MKLVTGGTSKIGREIVKLLGDDVLVHYHSNKSLATELSDNIIQADLTTIAGIESFLSRIGKFDVIVNNFGLYNQAELKISAWEDILRANLLLPVMLMGHIDSGVVINISSIGGHPGLSVGNPAYEASKAALNKFSDSFHKDGIRINAVAPGEVGVAVSAEEVAREVLRVINDPTINNQVIYLWGNAPEEQKKYAETNN